MWQRVNQPEVLAAVLEPLEPATRKALLSDRRPYWCCSFRNFESSIRYIKTYLRTRYASTPLLLERSGCFLSLTFWQAR